MPLLPEPNILWGLLVLFVVSFFSGLPIPMPLSLTVLWLSQYHEPIMVVLVSSVGTMLGWLCLDGVMRRWLQQRPVIQQKIPVAYQRFFMRQTGLWLFVFNAIPFPLDPVRYLALINDYPRIRLLSILGLSRLVRNTLLVTLGVLLSAYKTAFWIALIVLLILPVLLNRLLELIMARVNPDQFSR